MNPLQTPKKVQAKSLSMVGKKHTILYYKTDQFDFALPNQIKPFVEFKDEFLNAVKNEKKFTKHIADVEAGAMLGEEDSKRAKMDRVTSKFPINVPGKKKKKNRRKSLVPTPKPAKSPKASTTLSEFKVPKPNIAPGSVVTPKSGEKRKEASAPPVKPVVPKPLKAPKPTPEKDSDGEAEFDFDSKIESDNEKDDDYVEEPAKKKMKKDKSTELKKV